MSKRAIVQINKKIAPKIVCKMQRKRRVRGKISGTSVRPRVSVFRSNKHVFAQAIDDTKNTTIASISSYEKENKLKNVTVESAKKLGSVFSQRLKEKGIETAVFDRNGCRYHGIIKSFADGVREKIIF